MNTSEMGDIPGGDEGRRHIRCDVFDTAIATIDGEKYKCAIVNLSIGGAAVIFDVEFDNPPEEGTTVSLDIDGLGKMNGYVARHLDEGMAIKLNVSENKQDKLAAVMMQALNDLFFEEDDS